DIQATGWWDIVQLHLTLDNYRQVLEAQGMLQAFVNTVFIAVPSTLLPLAICALAAYAFSWIRFPMRDTLFLIVIAFLLVPVQVAFIPCSRCSATWFPISSSRATTARSGSRIRRSRCHSASSCCATSSSHCRRT